MVSICLSAFELAGFLFTPLHGWSISKIGRKNSIIIGFILMILSSTTLGLVSLIDKEKWQLFIVISFFARFVQGFGDS